MNAAEGPTRSSSMLHDLEHDAHSLEKRLSHVDGMIGTTMFDLPGSEDGSLTVVLPQDHCQQAPAQSLLRIKSGDGRSYLGIVVAGPFAEPDGLRGDSSMLLTVAVRGGTYQPPFHGRVKVSILGEELEDGTLIPPRLRPLPNSIVTALTDAESEKVLKADGDIRVGVVVGYENVRVGIPSTSKQVLPRHTAVLGTTGGGKSTTVARLVQQAQEAGMAVVVLDVEGEYTRLHEATTNDRMSTALAARGLQPCGIDPNAMTVYHLIGRDTANPSHPNVKPFSLQFAHLSPYAAAEILNLSEAQQQRFMFAYDVSKQLLRDLNIFPAKNSVEQERLAMDVDEFERGYPRMPLILLMDVVSACHKIAEMPKKERKEDASWPSDFRPHYSVLATPEGMNALRTRIFSGNGPGPVGYFPPNRSPLVGMCAHTATDLGLSRVSELRADGMGEWIARDSTCNDTVENRLFQNRGGSQRLHYRV